ncbi:succinylglutamate desuccinylase/aspartoacylase family protein [Natronosalvus vescus]|uniref:succinylglutamate desuccinylase/aspartoacylase family protein n=1 Tax=Natronosalvus vescus TaxID=2953881 RepID=UPI0020904BDE|nr:succinylglutamate desuccinylase/aspartoacylase family protein [Natronosalvus vescus]
MKIGSVQCESGTRTTGYLEVTTLPTGGAERLPVVVARGEGDGPTLWITGGIHGNEMTGVAAVQDVLTNGVPDGLRGTVVCVPMCNPSGIRRLERTSSYHDDDPNRFFPAADAADTTGKRVQELIDERLYEEIVDSADALLDLHTAQVGSVPFVIRDRVLYGTHRDEAAARDLAGRLDGLARATELPLVNEYPAEEYADRNLHRSTAGAVLNEAGIPALTLELGGHDAIEEGSRAAGVAAVYRAMRHLEMLPSVPESIAGADPGFESPVSFPVRRFVGPRAESVGICRPQIETGTAFEAEEAVADVVSPHGDCVETLSAPHDGYVLGWRSPVTYENDPVSSLAIRDEGDLVTPRS